MAQIEDSGSKGGAGAGGILEREGHFLVENSNLILFSCLSSSIFVVGFWKLKKESDV